jgi:plastocyanin
MVHKMQGLVEPGSRGQATRRELLALMGAAVLLAATRAGAKATEHRVSIKGLAYQPAQLTVKRGDVIVWTNDDPYPHTVTDQGVFDSNSIAAGASWRYTASKAGNFPYTCTFHPNMKGELKVE